MKCFLSHAASVFMALLVMVSTMSFTVQSHYCGNILVDKAIMKPAKTCSMHDSKGHQSSEDDHCCDEETEVVKGQNELKLSDTQTVLKLPLPLTVFTYIHFIKPVEVELLHSIVFEDSPPDLEFDYRIRHQVFLI